MDVSSSAHSEAPYVRRSDINSPQVTSILTRWSVTRQAEAGEGCTNIELFSTDGIQNLIRLERILSVLSVFVVGYFFLLFPCMLYYAIQLDQAQLHVDSSSQSSSSLSTLSTYVQIAHTINKGSCVHRLLRQFVCRFYVSLISIDFSCF